MFQFDMLVHGIRGNLLDEEDLAQVYSDHVPEPTTYGDDGGPPLVHSHTFAWRLGLSSDLNEVDVEPPLAIDLSGEDVTYLRYLCEAS